MEDNSPGAQRTQDHQFLDGPAWRWKLAQSRRTRRRLRHEDPMVQRAQDYLARCRAPGGRVAAAAEYPEIAGAETLNAEEALRDRLQILTIGGCERPEIAQRLDIDEAHIRTWEELFFDVRDAPEAVDWIQVHVIRPAETSGQGGLAARLKLAAVAGPVAAWAILDADASAPLSAGARLFQRKLKLHLKFEEAAAVRLDSPGDCLFFVKLHVTLKLAETRLRHDREKLQARCQEALRRHELATLRLELAAERDRQRDVEKQQRVAQKERQRRGAQQGARCRNPCPVSEDESRLLAACREFEREALRARAEASPLARLTWHVPSQVSAAATLRVAQHPLDDPKALEDVSESPGDHVAVPRRRILTTIGVAAS